MSDRFGHIPIQPVKPSAAPATPPVKKKRPAAKPSPPREPRKNSGMVWLWLIIPVVVTGIYSLLTYYGIPYYFTEIIPGKVKEKTGFILDPGEISFNPFTFEFAVSSTRVSSEEDVSVVSLKSLTARFAPLSLLRHDFVCNSIIIDTLELDISRDAAGNYNIKKLLGIDEEKVTSEIIDFSDLPFFFSLNNIAVRNSTIRFTDTPTGKKHLIEKIELDLPTFSNIPFQADQYLRPHFSAIINGSPVELTGQAHFGDSGDKLQASKLSCQLHDIDLPTYAEYLPFEIPFTFTQGKVNGTIDIMFSSEDKQGDRIIFGFELQVADATLQEKGQKLAVDTPLALINGSIRPISRSLHLSNITLREPRMTSSNGSLAGSVQAFLSKKESPSAIKGVTVPPYGVTIDLLILDNGSLTIGQPGSAESADTTWKSCQLSLKDYTSMPKKKDAAYGAFRMSAESANGAYLTWQGSIIGPHAAEGSLHIVKMEADSLLDTIGSGKDLDLTGLVDMKGKLHVSAEKAPDGDIEYKLSEASVTIQNFALLSEKKQILTTPVAQASPVSLHNGAINFGNILLKDGAASFAHGQLPKALTHFGTARYRLQGIEFDGRISVAMSKNKDDEILFEDITIKANQLDAPDTAKTNISILGKTSNAAILKAQGNVRLAPFNLSLKSGFSDFPLQETLNLFVGTQVLPRLTGKLSGKGTVLLPQKSFAGELYATNIVIAGNGGADTSCDKAHIQDINSTAHPFHFGASRSIVDGCTVLLPITRETTDPMLQFAEFLRSHLPSGDTSGEKKKITISPVDIQAIDFTNGRLQIIDNRLSPAWQGEATDFSGSITNIHSAASASTSSFTFSGLLDDSQFTISGETDFFQQKQNGHYRLSLDNYPLASFHHQLAQSLDINTGDGEVSLRLENTWQDKELATTALLQLTNVEPLSAAADSALPLALLTGQDNSFSMQIDLTRPAPTGQIALAEAAISQFQTLVVKATVSPLLLASGDFTDLIGNEFAEFRPGEFMLSEKGREALTRYSALLIAHPHIGLEMYGGVDMVIDRQALQQQLEAVEQKRVDLINKKRNEEWEAEKASYEASLQQRQSKTGPNGAIVEVDIPKKILIEPTQVQPVPVAVDDAMLLELANKRLNVLQQYFTTQLVLHPDRITVVPAQEGQSPPAAQGNGVSIRLTAMDR